MGLVYNNADQNPNMQVIQVGTILTERLMKKVNIPKQRLFKCIYIKLCFPFSLYLYTGTGPWGFHNPSSKFQQFVRIMVDWYLCVLQFQTTTIV